MKLLPLLWLLCGLLLVVGDKDPPVASPPKAPIAGNVTVSTLGNATSVAAAAGATGTPIAGDKVQSNNNQSTKIEQQQPSKEAAKTPAGPENVGKNRKRTDTDNPKPSGNATVTASTPKPAGVETKASTPAAAAAVTPAPSSKPVSSTAKPTAGSAIVSEGQSMKDVTKANNATSHQPGSSSSNNTIIISSTTASTSTTTSKTTTTTPKPTKPPVVFSMDTHPEWEQGKAGEKPPLPPKPPVSSTLAEPVMPQVQELTDRGDTSYVVPIVTVLLTVPLAIGVVTIMYRRFRDMWSTRHYRRMDFLVDGMYND